MHKKPHSPTGPLELLAGLIFANLLSRRHKCQPIHSNLGRENQIKQAIYKIVDNVEKVKRIFAIVKQQHDY
jgi:hypothetical protein